MPALKAEELRVGEEKGTICDTRKSAFWVRGMLGILALTLGRGLFNGVRPPIPPSSVLNKHLWG